MYTAAAATAAAAAAATTNMQHQMTNFTHLFIYSNLLIKCVETISKFNDNFCH